jgi:CubicO group peptidase (beta-lactamase class C family)
MKIIIYFFIIISNISCCHAQQSFEMKSLSEFIKTKTDSAFIKNQVPGIFIGVMDKGEHFYYNAGYANPETKMPFDSATLFEIGSITKTFTAFVLMNVLKEKKISDKNSIIKFLPDSVQNNKALQKISFLSLMNHTSGLPRLPKNMRLDTNPMAPYDDYNSTQLFQYLKEASPEPDAKSNYSNLGMGLAGVLAQNISGKSYASLLDQYIFLPFKLITPGNEISQAENKSQGYFDKNKVSYWNMNVLAPAGGLKCTSKEMLTYLNYMANPADTTSREIIEKLLEPTVAINPMVNVCRVWHTLEEKEKPIIYWHNGGTYGFSTFAAFIKGQQKAVIVAVNKFNENKVSDGLGISIMKELIK